MTIEEYIGRVEFDSESGMIQSEGDMLRPVVQVRGWGHIQTLFGGDAKASADFQDKIGEFVAKAINDALERTGKP